MITDKSFRIALFWISLVALVALLILNLLKGSKEWYVFSQPNPIDLNQLGSNALNPVDQQFPMDSNLTTLPGYQDSRLGFEAEMPTDSLLKGDPRFIANPPETDPLITRLQPFERADPLLLNKQKPMIDLRTGLPISTDESSLKSDPRLVPEQPVMDPRLVNSQYKNPSGVSIRNGIRKSDIRTLPKVGGSPVKKLLRQPFRIKKPQSPVKKYR